MIKIPTSTKSAGDIPEEHRQLVEQLEAFEKTVNTSGAPPDRLAQMYTCLAHDWYQLDMEEEGNRLVLKAEKVCPGYFKGPVIQHQVESSDFDTVIKNLTWRLLHLLTDTLRNDG